MLSPNARNLSRAIFGGAFSVTVNVHELVMLFASVATHVTVVVPLLNIESLAGVHVSWIGGAPPVVDAVPSPTAGGCRVLAVRGAAAGRLHGTHSADGVA